MKFTLSWLKSHLETDASVAEITDALTDLGLEVEGVENPAERLAAFKIGKVLTAEKHPDADKLQVLTSTLEVPEVLRRIMDQVSELLCPRRWSMLLRIAIQVKLASKASAATPSRLKVKRMSRRLR